MRGEDFTVRSRPTCMTGSPPHARGRLASVQFDVRYTGITPACAGKTWEMSLKKVDTADHPRMRGEDLSTTHAFLIKSGSPPHARGRPGNVLKMSVNSRITPACAGKTFYNVDLMVIGEGSPPHARGRHLAF